MPPDSNGYESIPYSRRRSSRPAFSIRNLVLLVVVVGGTLWVGFTLLFSNKSIPANGGSKAKLQEEAALHSAPWGVNLASWLSLEDYFFVGRDGAVQVATDWGHMAAQCFPPLHSKISWQSETDLLSSIATQFSVREAILAFAAYRNAFVDLHDDLPRIAAQGIRSVRVSMSWCLTDWDPTQDSLLDEPKKKASSKHHANNSTTSPDDNVLWDRYACVDPFFAQQGETVRWPAVPKALVQDFLRACRQYGLKAVLDIHTYPGGTSIGTFSGVWPHWSLFWKHDQPEHPSEDFGRQTFQSILEWIESLAESDPDAFAGLGGITPMNEPGHLAGIFGPGSWQPDKESFVPALPEELGNDYLSNDLNNAIPDGPHLRVLKWQSDAVETFRRTSLPASIDLVVNLHESILVKDLTPDDPNDRGGRHPQATQIIANWWKQVTTMSERSQWAVLDMHHYHAWEPQCQGTVTGHDGSYTCGDVDAATVILHECSSWAQTFRNALDEPTARLSSGEFSASTHHSVLESCLDPTTLRLSYNAQLEAASDASVDLYFWTWKMPYGGAFRPAWSWQTLMNRIHNPDAPPPDESFLACGIPRDGDV